MAEKLPPFVKREGDSILFNQDGEFIFYVLDEFFQKEYAIVKGEYVNLIGILDYAIFDEKGKNSGLKRFYFPSVFLTKPYAMDKMKNVRLTKTQEPKDYRLLRYKKGDQIIVSTKVPQELRNMEDFYKVFLYGKLPTTIPYDKLQDYFNKNINLNGSSYGLNIQIFGMVISEMCRDPHDLSKPFRNSNFTDLTAYKPISIKDIPKYVSPHQSISSENWDEALIGAIMHPTDIDSPLETLVMGE